MNYTNYKTIQTMKKSERAEVLFASVEGLDMPVVVKRLTEASPEVYHAVAKLENPHVPRIYAVEEQEKELCIVEEYIDGRTLNQYLKQETLTDVQKLDLMLQLCDALEALHGCNPPVIHRDIKPSNILVTTDGVLKIIDFDASRQYNAEKRSSDTRLLGTVEYAAPEQFGYAQTDIRSDIYSAGIVFSELGIGKDAPFAKDWKRIIGKCTSFDPENRYENAAELKWEIKKCILKTKPGRKFLVPAAVSVAVMLLLLGSVFLLGKDRETPVVDEEKNSLQVQTEATVVPTEEPEGIEGVALLCDRYAWKEDTLPVVAKLRKKEYRRVEKVYLCESSDTEDPFLETIAEIPSGVVEISKDGKELRLGTTFFGTYNYPDKLCLYVEFDNGTGERIWLTYGENVPEDSAETSYTEIFTYETTEDNKIILTGMTEGAKADKRNRKLSVPKAINGMPVVEIAEGAFAWIPLTSVDLPEGLLTIGKGAFYGCNLYTVKIPATVTYVAPKAFGANYGMITIWAEEENRFYRSRIGVLYDEERKILYQVPANFAGDTFTVSADVTEIGEYAFGNCRNLKLIYCEESEVKLGEHAFWDTLAAVEKREVLSENLADIFYTPDHLNYADSYSLSYQLHDNKALSIRYEKIYSELIYAFPDIVDLNRCKIFEMKYKSEAGSLAVKFYDEELNLVEACYPKKGDGVQTFSYAPKSGQKIGYIGVMAYDEELMDYSDFETTIYSFLFRFEHTQEEIPVTYTPQELQNVKHYSLEYTYGEDGSVFLEYEKIYGAIYLAFPEPLDISKCSGIEVKMKNENALLTFKLVDENWEEIEVFYDYMTDGVQTVGFSPNCKKKAYGVSFMTNDKAFSYGETCETTIYSMTLYMRNTAE